LRRRLGRVGDSLGTAEAVSVLMGSVGVGSASAADRQAANAALGSAMMENADGVHPLVLPHLADLLDRSQHDALPPTHILIFKTPPGKCLS
jgi:hypothetical protein